MCTTMSTCLVIIIGSLLSAVNNAEGFELCTKLNLAGCGVTTINPFIRGFINDQIHAASYNYSLPFDPCEFHTINMSWILSLIDTTILTYITAEQVLTDMPCEISIQMPPDFLSSKGLSAITNETFWFGPTGHCIHNASNIVDCSDPNRTIANYTSEPLECFYPFVPSKYETPFKPLYDAGLTHCGVSCGYTPYMSDIQQLDAFNYASSMIALICGIAFFINTSLELHNALKSGTAFSELPLLFDIPVLIAIWLMVLTILNAVPSWIGKEYFACEIGTNAKVMLPSRVTNVRCYIAGQLMLLSVHSIYVYGSLLTFVIWRSVAKPWSPLFKIHKKWYHVGANVIVLAQYIGAMSEDIFHGNNISGLCGPSVTGELGIRYLLCPMAVYMCTFTVCTGLSIHTIWRHLDGSYKHAHGDAEKAITQLAIRLVVYSVFVASSLACLVYVSARFVLDGAVWRQELEDNIACYTDNALLGKEEECPLDLTIEDGVYWMQGVVLILVSVASFVLSCTNKRYNDYGKMKAMTKRKLESIVRSNSVKTTPKSMQASPSSIAVSSNDTLRHPKLESKMQESMEDGTTIVYENDVSTVAPSKTEANELDDIELVNANI
eukprot:1010409_1